MKPVFVKTKNVKGLINLIHNLKNKSENITKIGLVYGNAGLGKTKTALYLSIHNKAKSFRQIVNTIDTFEKVAQANGLIKIGENIVQEILNG